MRKLLIAATLGLLVTTAIGCVIPGYSGDPSTRTAELMYTSENLRLAMDEWERAWLLRSTRSFARLTARTAEFSDNLLISALLMTVPRSQNQQILPRHVAGLAANKDHRLHRNQ